MSKSQQSMMQRNEDGMISAAPVALQKTARDMGYRFRMSKRFETGCGEAGGGVSHVESRLVAYDNPAHRPDGFHDDETLAVPDRLQDLAHRFGLLSTPSVRVEGREINPLAAYGAGEFLRSEVGRQLLAALGHGEEEVNWTQGPKQIDEKFGALEPWVMERPTRVVTSVGVVDERQALLTRVVRVEHEDDVIFVVSSWSLPIEAREERELIGEEAIFPLSLQDAWADWFKHTLDNIYIPPFPPRIYRLCELPPQLAVSITNPQNNGGVYSAGNPRVRIGHLPYAVINTQAQARGCYDHLKWSYRMTSSGSVSCPHTQNQWVDAGTGKCTKLRLYDCVCGNTAFEVRVQAVANDGTILLADTINFIVNIWGC